LASENTLIRQAIIYSSQTGGSLVDVDWTIDNQNELQAIAHQVELHADGVMAYGQLDGRDWRVRLREPIGDAVTVTESEQ
jgi:hypothetical protein